MNTSFKKQLSRIFNGSIPNDFVFFPDAHKIIMDTEANIFLNNNENVIGNALKLKFDVENELVFIQKWTQFKIVSARFNKKISLKTEANGNTVIVYARKDYPGLAFNGNKIPEPAKGDTVFVINKDLNKISEFVISEKTKTINEVSLILDGKLNLREDQILCWIKEPYYSKSTTNHPNYQNDDSLQIYSEKINDREFDMVVDFNHIGGLEFYRG